MRKWLFVVIFVLVVVACAKRGRHRNRKRDGKMMGKGWADRRLPPKWKPPKASARVRPRVNPAAGSIGIEVEKEKGDTRFRASADTKGRVEGSVEMKF